MNRIGFLFFALQAIAFGQQTTSNATNWGTNVVQNSGITNGGYIRFSPVTYNPFDGASCRDAYGNLLQQPFPTQGASSFGPNDLVLWNSLSPSFSYSGLDCPITTLAANIDNAQTTITVASGAKIQNNTVIQIDHETMLVTAGGGTNTLTVTRGFNINYNSAGTGVYPCGSIPVPGPDGYPCSPASHTSGTKIGGSLPANSSYGVNTNGYMFSRVGFASDYGFWNTIQLFQGGIQAGSFTNYYLYPAGSTICTAMSGGTCTSTTTLSGNQWLGGHITLGKSSGPPVCTTTGTPTAWGQCSQENYSRASALNPLTFGEGLQPGTMYWDSTLNCVNTYNGSSWSCLGSGGGGGGGSAYFCSSTGTASAITCAATPSGFAYTPGVTLSIYINTTNASPTTLNVNSLGARNIYSGGSPIASGSLVAGNTYSLIYDGTNFNTLALTTPGGPTNSVQYNNSGVFGGSSNFNYNPTTGVLAVCTTTGGACSTTSGVQAYAFSSSATGSDVAFTNTSSSFVIKADGHSAFQEVDSNQAIIGVVNAGSQGTVNTVNTAVTLVSGSVFNTLWVGAGYYININGVDYGIASVTDQQHLTLSSSAGTQTGVAYYYDGTVLKSVNDTFRAYGNGDGYFQNLLLKTLSVGAPPITSNPSPTTISSTGLVTSISLISDIVNSGAQGTVTTVGNNVTWVSGNYFSSYWPPSTNNPGTIKINNVSYTIATVTSPTSLTLTSSAGNQTGVSYYYTGNVLQSPNNTFFITGGGASNFQTTALALLGSAATGASGNALISATTSGVFVSLNGGTPTPIGSPTWPTSGYILISAGPGSNPTGLAPGISGNCLVSNGTGWTSGSCSGSTTAVNSVSGTGIITNSSSTGNVAISWGGTSGGIPYFSSNNSLVTSGVLGANQLVLGGGAGASPFTTSNLTYNPTTGVLLVASSGTTPGIITPTFNSSATGSTYAFQVASTNYGILGTGAAGFYTLGAGTPVSGVQPFRVDSSGNLTVASCSGCGGGAAGVTSLTGTGVITNVTSSGAVALTVAGTTGGIVYFDSGSTWKSSGALQSNAVVLGNTSTGPFTSGNLTFNPSTYVLTISGGAGTGVVANTFSSPATGTQTAFTAGSGAVNIYGNGQVSAAYFSTTNQSVPQPGSTGYAYISSTISGLYASIQGAPAQLIALNNSSPYFGTVTAKGVAGVGTASAVLTTNGLTQGERSDLMLQATFQSTLDNIPRRTADIVAGFNGGSWGTEYLTFNVGYGGASNDSANLTLEKMRITSGGNVGILNPNPLYALDVTGDINNTGNIITGGALSATSFVRGGSLRIGANTVIDSTQNATFAAITANSAITANNGITVNGSNVTLNSVNLLAGTGSPLIGTNSAPFSNVFSQNFTASANLTMKAGSLFYLTSGSTWQAPYNAGSGKVWTSDSSGNGSWVSPSGGSGTVTSIATSSPITGGTITTSGTIGCPTCVTSITPGTGVSSTGGTTPTISIGQSVSTSSSPSFSGLSVTGFGNFTVASGGVQFGTNNGSQGTSGNGLVVNKSGSSVSMAAYDSGGYCNIGTLYGTTGIGCTSDGTLKHNIQSIGSVLTSVLSLRPVTYTWNSNNVDAMGFVAQEVQSAVPDFKNFLVSSNPDGKLVLAMGNMIPLLVRSIQELQAEIDDLKAKLAAK